ncbi:MAG TPA: glycosyltransferase [Verrucomicrobiae bacterium]|nr:glycosyltransferase [Verrucomicrobiae bacterium]
MISFVVPAHNEQVCLPGTLRAIHDSARACNQEYEIIVVDDASTDATAEMARTHEARVISVHHRQIAATRNSGGRAAKGDRIFFVDADTTINPRTLCEALRAIDGGAAGGGGAVWIDWREPLPLYGRIIAVLAVIFPKLIGFTGGAFMFCTRAAFQATGGFDERLYWSEEGKFAMALRREGRFYVPWRPVLTSGRRLRKTSGGALLVGAVRMLASPVKFLTDRQPVQKIWYDSNRATDHILPNTWAVRISNAIALLFMLVMLSGLLGHLVPWEWTPRERLSGRIRLGMAIFCCHIGLVLGPLALLLLVNLLRQKRWTGVFQSVVWIAFCIWQGFGAVRVVVWAWSAFGAWVMNGLSAT